MISLNNTPVRCNGKYGIVVGFDGKKYTIELAKGGTIEEYSYNFDIIDQESYDNLKFDDLTFDRNLV